MELEELHMLDHGDQVTMLVGRLSRETVDLEVALRSSVATMRGQAVSPLHGEFLFSAELKVARQLVQGHREPVIVQSALDALGEAQRVYNERNRYVHDLLIADASGQVDRVRLVNDRAVLEPVRLTVDIAAMERAVLDTLHATWRVRAIALCWTMTNRNVTHWLGILKGRGTVGWDGTLVW